MPFRDEYYNGSLMSGDSFQGAVDFLYSFADFSVERSYRYSAEVFELQRVKDLLHSIGDPQEKFKAFHVAGTKGKGSVSAMMASILRNAGYRTGLYTSPHLVRLNERFQIDGRPISDDEFVALIEELKPRIDSFPGLTVFEILTSMAFLFFTQQGADCAVIEVGLGGRLDATNVLDPLVSVITTLSYDHMHLLGDSLSDIAREKAGIIKPGIPIVLSPQQIEAELVVASIAEERSSPIIRVGKDWLFSSGSRGLDGQVVYIWSSEEQSRMDAFVESAGSEEWVPPRYELPLLGYHQITNAATAYAAIKEASKNGLSISEAAIRDGFNNVSWPGRFQIISHKPAVVVDAAHNRDSALKLRIALDDYFPGQPVILIFGASEDKDIQGMLDELLPRVDRLIVTRSEHQRAEKPEFLASIAHQHGLQVESVEPVSKALEAALGAARIDDVILATGSVFVVGEILASWEMSNNSRGGRKE